MLRRRRTATPILNGATLLSGANARAAPNSCGGTPYAPLQTLVELLKPPRRVRWERAPFRATRARAPKFGTGSKGREASVHNSQMALHNGRTPLDTRHIVPRVTAFEASAGLASSPPLAHRSPSESAHDSHHADHDSYAMTRSTTDGRAPDGGRRWRRRVRAARSVVRHPAGGGASPGSPRLAVWLRLSPRRKVDEVGARDGARGSGGRGLRRRSVREPRAERVDDHRHRVIVRREAAAAAAAGLARRNSRLGFKSRRRALRRPEAPSRH